MNLIQKLTKKGLISPPKWLPQNLQYLTDMGSHAYGVANKGKSDFDVYGMCIPPKHIIFPHHIGMIYEFDTGYEKFNTWQQHHIISDDPNKPTEWDFTVWNIIKYFMNLRDASPNVIDSLFTPQDSVRHATPTAVYIRENRRMFLSKKIKHSFSGYAYSQLQKMTKHEEYLAYAKWAQENGVPLEATADELNADWRRLRSGALDQILFPGLGQSILWTAHRKLQALEVPTTKRISDLLEYGYDLKFAYHLVRLILEAEQLLDECDLDLRRNSETLKAIRKGLWAKEQVIDYFQRHDKALEAKYHASKLPHKPNTEAIRNLLLECLEMHYGNLGPDLITQPRKHVAAVHKIHEITSALLGE